jgi:hypothetical protein
MAVVSARSAGFFDDILTLLKRVISSHDVIPAARSDKANPRGCFRLAEQDREHQCDHESGDNGEYAAEPLC